MIFFKRREILLDIEKDPVAHATPNTNTIERSMVANKMQVKIKLKNLN